MSPTVELSGEILALFVGKVENRWPGKAPSAIGKQPTDSLLRLEKNGFTEDSQADLKVHGGPEKAVHHYAVENMNYWRQVFPDHAEIFMPGCFGENMSTTGLTEQNLCLGDILSMGSATVQICQGRQPCWKLNAHTNIPQMAAAFQRTARTGWYYRVLETGSVQVGNLVRLIDRPEPNWPLHRLISTRFDRNLSLEDANELANSQTLSESWRDAFQKKRDRSYKENTAPRLKG